MNGRLVAGGTVLIAAVAGAAMYYLQVYGYYYEVAPDAPEAQMRMVSVATGAPEPIIADDVRAIDADSSPLRFRACFTTPTSLATLTETYQLAEKPVPLNGPSWFDCYDAGAIGEALESGEAVAFVSQTAIHPGVDRIIAVFPDGHAYAWHQLEPEPSGD